MNDRLKALTRRAALTLGGAAAIGAALGARAPNRERSKEMLTIRRADERGHAHHGWLDTRHTFSFANYYDPNYMGFRSLRVINDDRVLGGAGFPPHPHRDMEIISYVVEGGLEHKDSTGAGGVVRPGGIQYMSAGAGVMHSEYNASDSERLRFLQLWIMPDSRGGKPTYGQKQFSVEERTDKLRLLASPDGAEGSFAIRQNARLYASLLSGGKTVEHSLDKGRKAWVQVVNGDLTVNGEALKEGDGVATIDVDTLALSSKEGAELLVFDLA